MGLLSFLLKFIVNVSILILFITFMPGLLPDVPITKPYKIPKVTLDGKLTPNQKLDKVEILFEQQLVGPESFADDGNSIYTSLVTGDIVKLVGKHIVPVVKFGKPCKGLFEERICGRPLGLRFGNDGYLYAADAYYGIYKVDVKTGDKTRLVAFGQEIEGKPTRLPNSLAVSCNGDIYWTDSSSDFILQDGVFTFLADPSGRLIHYNAKTGENKVLMDGGLFTNGIALSKNENFVIITDSRNQILRHYLKGPKAGTTENFVKLPGIPDNIQTDGGTGFLISVISESNAEHPMILTTLSQFPLIRKFLARSLSLVEVGFRLIDKIYPNEVSQRTIHFVGHFASTISIIPSRSVVLHVSENGEILDTLWTNTKYNLFSEAHIVKNHLYLGSPFNDYLARISLSEIGWQHLSKKTDSLTARKQSCATLTGEVKPKVVPTTTTQKPTTTTTPKPTTTTTPKPTTTTTPKPTTTTTPKPTTTTPKPTTTTPKPTTTTPKPTTTTPKPTTTTPKPTTTTPKPTTTTTPKPTTTTTPKPTTTSKAPSVKEKTNTPPSKPSTTTTKQSATIKDKEEKKTASNSEKIRSGSKPQRNEL